MNAGTDTGADPGGIRPALWALILAALALIMFAPGLTALPPMDRDEPRFAQATRQMLASGDYIDIRFQEESRYKKPVGIYWLQAAAVSAVSALGDAEAPRQIWAYRLPSLAGAILAVLMTYWTALALTDRRGALVAALLMSTALLLAVEAHLAKTDAALLACVMIAMGGLARAFTARDAPAGPGLGVVLAFWAAIGVGLLIKGPVAPMFPALTALGLCLWTRSWRWLKRLRPGLGLMVALAITLPWVVAIVIRSGGAFFSEAVGHDMLSKVAGGQESHGAPPGTFLALFWVTAWPLAPLAALAAPALWRRRREDAVRFLVCWLIPAWLVFEAVPTKLPHYLLPVYPAVAILTGLAALEPEFGAAGRWRKLVSLMIPFLPVALLIGLPVACHYLGLDLPWLALGGMALAAGLAVLATAALRRRRLAAALGLLMATAFTTYAAAFQFGVPGLAPFTLSTRAAAAAYAAGCPAPLRMATTRYREPSLIFLTETDLTLTATGAEAAQFLSGVGCRLVLIRADESADFNGVLTAKAISASKVDEIRGLNINGGKQQILELWLKR